jgi:mRNA interferase RelE/StbE
VTWKVDWSDGARKQLRKLDKKHQTDILKYLSGRIAFADNPCKFGKPLRYGKNGLWRYRVGDLRIICQIREKETLVRVLGVGHRKSVYSKNIDIEFA